MSYIILISSIKLPPQASFKC